MGRTRGKEERSGERSGRWTCRVGFCSLTDAIRQCRSRYWSSNQISTSATVVDGPAQGIRGSMAGVTLASRPLLLPLQVCGSGGGMVQTGAQYGNLDRRTHQHLSASPCSPTPGPSLLSSFSSCPSRVLVCWPLSFPASSSLLLILSSGQGKVPAN